MTTGMREMEKLAESAAETIRAVAQEIVRPAFAKRTHMLSRHDDGSLVTDADIACQIRLKEEFTKLTPSTPCIGEEDEPDAFPDDFWVVDPIDGTSAFARGDQDYGVMAALVIDGRTRIGIIHQPETGRTAVAVKGAGCRLDGRLVKLVQAHGGLGQQARVAFACRNTDAQYESLLGAEVFGYEHRKNSSHDYLKMLAGGRDATFYSEGVDGQGRGKCPPWDHAAGVLMVTEAGGVAALPYAERAVMQPTPALWHDCLLVATTPALFEDMRAHVYSLAPELCRPRDRRRTTS